MEKIWGLISRMKFSRQKINLLYVALNYSKLFSNPLILSIHMYIPIMQKRKKRINSKSDFFLPNFFLQNLRRLRIIFATDCTHQTERLVSTNV